MKGRKGRERETGEKEGEISGMEKSGIPAEQKKRRTSITSWFGAQRRSSPETSHVSSNFCHLRSNSFSVLYGLDGNFA